MEFNLLEAISSVGFPIACCVYMIYNNNKTVKDNNDTLKHMSDVITENTTVMKQLSNLITHFITGGGKSE